MYLPHTLQLINDTDIPLLNAELELMILDHINRGEMFLTPASLKCKVPVRQIEAHLSCVKKPLKAFTQQPSSHLASSGATKTCQLCASCTSHLPALIDIRHEKVVLSKVRIQHRCEREHWLRSTLISPLSGISLTESVQISDNCANMWVRRGSQIDWRAAFFFLPLAWCEDSPLLSAAFSAVLGFTLIRKTRQNHVCLSFFLSRSVWACQLLLPRLHWWF